MRPDWRKAVLYAAIIGIEGCWLYALMSLLNRKAAGDGLSVAGILVLYPAALGLHALLRRLGWPNFFVRVINWLGWAAGMLLVLKLQLYGGLAWADTTWLLAIPRAFLDILFTFRPELLVLASSGVIWWMGRRLTNTRAGFTTLVTEFQFGLFMLLAAFFSAAMLKVTLDHTLLLTLAFFLISLLGISTAHALENTTWLAGLQRGRWTGLLVASVIAVIIVGFIISLLVTPDLLRLVVAGIKWVYEIVMAGLLWVAEWMVRLMPDIDRSQMPPTRARHALRWRGRVRGLHVRDAAQRPAPGVDHHDGRSAAPGHVAHLGGAVPLAAPPHGGHVRGRVRAHAGGVPGRPPGIPETPRKRGARAGAVFPAPGSRYTPPTGGSHRPPDLPPVPALGRRGRFPPPLLPDPVRIPV
ncbi:MAG: hypothetical protein ABID71_03555 [Chloroflexota bacterium]